MFIFFYLLLLYIENTEYTKVKENITTIKKTCYNCHACNCNCHAFLPMVNSHRFFSSAAFDSSCVSASKKNAYLLTTAC